MAIPTTIESLSTTASSNGPSGSDDRSTADDGLRYAYAFIRQTVSLGANIASASTITPPSTGYAFNITGTTTINTIASTNSWDGRLILLIFAGALQLTHSSNLALPGSANITTAANDIAEFVQTASGSWRLVNYRTAADSLTVQGALTVNGNTTLGNAGTDTVTTNGNVTVNAPTAGTTTSINNVSGARNLALVGASGSAAYLSIVDGNTGTREYQVLVGAPTGTFAIRDSTAAADRYTVNSTGNHTFNASSSGDTLSVSAISNRGLFLAGSTNPAMGVREGAGSTFWVSASTTELRIGGVGSSAPSAGVIDISDTGNVTLNAASSGYALNLPTKTPSSAADTGTAGDISWDTSYIYVCTAANTWKRSALSTW